MNFSLHITSLWGKSFDAYPLDSKADYLKYLSTDGDGSNIAVWVEGGVIYYYSFFKLPGESVFGILLSFKDLVITEPAKLLKLLSDLVAEGMPRKATILKYDTDGNLIFANPKLADSPDAVENLRNEIFKILSSNRSRLGVKSMNIPSLPSPKDVTAVRKSEDFAKIENLIFNEYNAVIMSDGNVWQDNATYSVISGLQTQIEEKDGEIVSLKGDVAKLERARKQYRFVIVMLAFLCIAGIGLFRLNRTLNETAYSLSQANDTIVSYHGRLANACDTISARDNQIVNLVSQVDNLEYQKRSIAQDKKTDSLNQCQRIEDLYLDINNLNDQMRRLRTQVSTAESNMSAAQTQSSRYKTLMSSYPFIATGFSKAGNTLYISYNALANKSASIEIRCFTRSSYLDKCDKTVSVKEGSGKLTLEGVRGLSSAEYVVVYSGGHIIAGQWF